MDEKYVAKLMKSMVNQRMKLYLAEDLKKHADKIAKVEAAKFLKSHSKDLEKAVIAEYEELWPSLLKEVVEKVKKNSKLRFGPAETRRYY